MYYSNLQINYMVTVLVFTFAFMFYMFACVFSNTDTVSWMVQIKVML